MRNEAELMVDQLEELRASGRAGNPGSEEDLSELIFAMDDALSTSRQAAVAQVAGAKAEDPWDRYTREFIERHKLEERRVKKAWELCGRCKDLRHRIMKENNLAKKIRQWEAIRKALDVPNSSTPALVRVDRTLRRLRAPVERIFNERLKSGLEEIARKK